MLSDIRTRLVLSVFCLLSFATVCSVAKASESILSPHRTVDDILRSVDSWVVALKVVRTKDLPRPKSRFVPQIPSRLLSREARDYEKRPKGYVTGLLVDHEGHILTSLYNVAGELKSIEVALPGGQKRAARLLAKDEVDDLALVRVEGDEPVVAKEAWKDPPWAEYSPKGGRLLVAVGRSPDPRALTVTQGIVSASGRNGNRAFQTDAKLNYGNVGGPLVDLDGRIVGVGCFVGHTQPQWGVNSGIGFGATVSIIRAVLPTLKKGQDIKPPTIPLLGVRPGANDVDIEGSPILQIIENSAAFRGGIREGDIIVEYNGRRVDTFEQLRRFIFCNKVSDKVTLKVRRGKEILELKVTLGSRES